MKRIQLLCIIALLIFSMGFSIMEKPYQTQQTQVSNSANNLDVLFLIDRSGSMSGDANVKPSDPLGLRFFGPMFAMQWMGSDHLFVHNASVYRMGVIHFGSTAKPGVEWQTITPTTVEEWKVVRDELKNKLSPGDMPNQSLGNTNFINALELARGYFQKLDQSNDTKSDKKIIVILTDGAPYVEGEGETFSIGNHMNQVQDIVNRHFPTRDGYSIYVASIQNPSKNTWLLMKPYWDKITGGRAVQITSTDDIGAYFQNILIEQTEDFEKDSIVYDEPVEPGRILVNPFVQSLSFTFFKSALDQGYSISLPDGSDLFASKLLFEALGNEEPIETININNPPPGYWTISVRSSSPMQIRMRQVIGKGILILPQGKLTENLPIAVNFSLLGIDGQSIPDYDAPLNLKAKITKGNLNFVLDFTPSGNGLYGATFVPQETGLYDVSFEATTVNNAGKYIEILRANDTIDIQPITAEVNATSTSVNLFQPVDLGIILRDTYGRIITSLPQGISFKIQTPNDTGVLPVTYNGEQFHTTYNPKQPGNYSLIMVNDGDAQTIQSLRVSEPTVLITDPLTDVFAFEEINISVDVEGIDREIPYWLEENKNAIVVEARVEDVPVAVEKINTGSYIISYRPTQSGKTSLSLVVGIDSVGDPRFILAEKTFNFTVNKSTPVKIETNAIQREAWRSFSLDFPFLKAKPWEIGVQVVGVDEKPLGLNEITAVDPNTLFTITVYKGQYLIPQENIRITHLENGKIQILGDVLSQGDYIVKIEPKRLLLPGYVWVDSSVEVRLILGENPLVILLQIASVILLISVLYFAYKKIRALLWSKRPCSGYLIATDLDKRIIWIKNLNESKSSFIEVGKAEMGLLPARYLRIWNSKNKSVDNEKIRVSYKLNSGLQKTIELNNGDSKTIESTDYLFQYVIDPDPKQIKEGKI